MGHSEGPGPSRSKNSNEDGFFSFHFLLFFGVCAPSQHAARPSVQGECGPDLEVAFLFLPSFRPGVKRFNAHLMPGIVSLLSRRRRDSRPPPARHTYITNNEWIRNIAFLRLLTLLLHAIFLLPSFPSRRPFSALFQHLPPISVLI